MADTNQPPFLPVKFPTGPPTTEKNVWEDGPGNFANPPNSTTAVRYTGQSQTGFISSVYLPPPVSPGKCRLPGAAIGMSKIP